MLDEYLALGGVELGNNARAYDYASCLSCCAGLLKLPGCDGIHDATSGFTNAEWEWQERATNLFPNPSFEAGATKVAVRRNYNRWPGAAASGTTGWTGYRTNLTNPGGYIRGVVNEATTVGAAGIVGNSGTASMIPVVPGEVWTLSTELRSAKTVTIGLQYFDAAGNYVAGSQTYGNPVRGAGSWSVSRLVSTVPAGAAFMRPVTFFYDQVVAVGDVMDMRLWTAEKTSVPVGAPFDGTQRPAVKRNLAMNPRARATGLGWLSDNGATHVATKGVTPPVPHPQGIETAVEFRIADGLSSPVLASMYNPDALATSGPERMLGMWVLVNEPGYRTATVIPSWPSVDLPANEWVWVETTSPTAAGAYSGIGITKLTGNASATARAYFTGALVVAGSSPVGTFFDGATEAAPGFGVAWDGTSYLSSSHVYDTDLSVSWTGTPDASESVVEGVVPTSVPTFSSVAVAIKSTRWKSSGAVSFRQIPRYSARGSAYTEIASHGNPMGLQAGKTYTVMAKFYQEQVQPVSSSINRSITVATTSYSEQAPNVVGESIVRLVFTVPASTWYLRLYNGGMIGDPDCWWDDLLIVEGDYGGPYFDGATLPDRYDPTLWRTSWSGTADASTSLLEEYTLVTPAVSAEPAYSCSTIDRAPWYDQSNPFSSDFAGYYLLSVKGITDGTMTAGVTESVGYGGVVGTPHYATRSVRVRSMLVGCGRAATHYGLAWLKAALGESFCSRHGDACGTSDLAFFIDCPPNLDPGDADYASTVSPYRRYLHDVSCTSSPIIQEEYETPSGAYVVIVEYILTAESPFVWGETVQAESTGAVLTAFDDIPFNLMRRPSGEQGDGVPAVVATQYAFNGSAEYGGSASALPTGWARTQTNISAGLTDAKSSDIAAVGPNSARVRLLATGAVSAGTIRLYYDVALGSLPAGSAPSVSLWAAALTYAGSPVLAPISAEVEWRTASATVSTAPLGQIPVNGGNISAPGLTRPPTATVARLAVTLPITSAVSGDDIRLYADAFGLTVP